jgi:hypothetical protein
MPPSLAAEARLELHRIPRGAALEALDRAGAIAEAELLEGPGGGAERPEIERVAATTRELARRVAGREQELWRVGLVVAGRAASRSRAERTTRDLARRFSSLGFQVRPPRFGAEDALAPPRGRAAETRPAGYWHTLHTDGVAAFFPFVDEAVVEPGGVLVGLQLEDASPVIVNRWNHASHSWGIFGTTGSGKSFAAALLGLRGRWVDPEGELIIIDPLGEFVPFVRALGGEVLRLGPDAPARLNPLDPVSTGGDRAEKAARIGPLIRTLFPSLTDEEGAALDHALAGLFADGPEVPTLSDLRRRLSDEGQATARLPTLLRVLTEGSLRHLDGPTTVRPGGSPLVVALEGVPEEHLPFHLAYLLEWLHGRLRTADRRRLVIVDEAHFLVRRGPIAEFLDGLLRHVRHYRAGFLLLSQHPEDFLASAPGRSILGNLRATLLLRLTRVSAEVREAFQLTPAEAEWLPRARLPREAGYSEGLLRLGSSHLPLAVVASTPEFEFLTRHLAPAGMGGARVPAATDGKAALSHPGGPVLVDERRGPVPGGSARSPP